VRIASIGVVALVACALTLPASAREPDPGPLVTDRPDVTESSKTVPRGYVQIEAGYNFARFDDGPDTVEVSTFPTTLLRVGLTPEVELRFEWVGYVSESRETGGVRVDTLGSGNTALGAKIKLRDERGAAPDLALLIDAIVPTGSLGIRTERIDPAARLLGSNTLTDRLALGYNLGIAALTIEDAGGGYTTETLGRYSVSLAIGIVEKWGSFAEFFGFVPLSGSEPSRNLFDAGFTYLASDSVQLDFSGGVGLNEAADDWFVAAGFSIRLPR